MNSDYLDFLYSRNQIKRILKVTEKMLGDWEKKDDLLPSFVQGKNGELTPYETFKKLSLEGSYPYKKPKRLYTFENLRDICLIKHLQERLKKYSTKKIIDAIHFIKEKYPNMTISKSELLFLNKTVYLCISKNEVIDLFKKQMVFAELVFNENIWNQIEAEIKGKIDVLYFNGVTEESLIPKPKRVRNT